MALISSLPFPASSVVVGDFFSHPLSTVVPTAPSHVAASALSHPGRSLASPIDAPIPRLPGSGGLFLIASCLISLSQQ